MISEATSTSFGMAKSVVNRAYGFKGSWLGLWLTELGAEVTGGLNPNNEQKLFEQPDLKQRLQNTT